LLLTWLTIYDIKIQESENDLQGSYKSIERAYVHAGINKRNSIRECSGNETVMHNQLLESPHQPYMPVFRSMLQDGPV
jgi:hypothetical protein